MMSRTIRLIFSATIILSILASGCAYHSSAGNIIAKPEYIKIGAILIFSGAGSNWGEDSKRGIEMALDRINSDGGILGKQLKIIYENNPDNNPTSAANAIHKLNSQGINIVIGPSWTTSALAIAPIVCQNNILLVSPTVGSAEFHQTCDYILDLWSNDDLLSKELAKYLYENGYREIAVLGSQDSWEKTQADNVKKTFEEIGGKVVSFQITAPDEQDFRTEALKIKESDAEAVVFTNYAFEHLSAKRLREIGFNKPFFSVVIDDERVKNAEGAFEGTTAVNSITPSSEFTYEYRARYNKEPDAGADSSYDAVMLIAQAIEKTGSTDPPVLKEYLKTIKKYSGASGNLTFTGDGGIEKPPVFLIVKNNELKRLTS
jgi:branched-chain amino acid transport system substrate-binding protein